MHARTACTLSFPHKKRSGLRPQAPSNPRHMPPAYRVPSVAKQPILSAFLQPRSQFRPHVSCLDVCPRFSLSSHSCPDRCCRHSNLSRGWGVVLFKKSFWLSQVEGNAKISGVGLKNLHQLNTAGPGNRTPAPWLHYLVTVPA